MHAEDKWLVRRGGGQRVTGQAREYFRFFGISSDAGLALTIIRVSF